jgi:hypothetical protein
MSDVNTHVMVHDTDLQFQLHIQLTNLLTPLVTGRLYHWYGWIP